MAGVETQPLIEGGVAQSLAHDSAYKHVSGEALYLDDIPTPADCLSIYIAYSCHAHALIKHLDLTLVRSSPGVAAVLSAADIPGRNDVSPICGDDPIFAESVVEYAGQSIFAVVAETRDQARSAAAKARVDYQVLTPIVTIEQALEQKSFILEPRVLERGDVDAALKDSPYRLSGRQRIGSQDHFYLEGQAALALPMEDGDVQIWSSTQHPTEVQHLVARMLDRPYHAVTVTVRRMGGAFGGKETQAALFAAVAALAANRTGRAAKVIVDRDDDMILTGKRHDFLIDYDVGFGPDGEILGLDLMLASRCGRSADLSGAVNDRAVFHVDNCYFLQNVRIVSHRCKTHTVSNTAFRGFGGPQGMIPIEQIIERIAWKLKLDPLTVRKLNFYGQGERNLTPYEMRVEDNILPELVEELRLCANYTERRAAIRLFNANSQYIKKGLALSPVKFGIAFTTTHLNQAGALVHVLTDGSIQLNHGGTEMGQGLLTKVAQIVAEEFQVDVSRIKITATATDKVPNTSATAASSGTDLNGKAAQAAARIIKCRLLEFAAERYDAAPAEIEFVPDHLCIAGRKIPFTEVVQQAHMARISLSSTGYYRTPKIHYDAKTGKGRPFLYFAYGAAVTEVAIDLLTGESRVERVDILHDVGSSLNPAIDLGQIEGGFIQGMGWLTSEELCWDSNGHLSTHAPSTYKIPTCGDRPADMRIHILKNSPNRENTIFHSKAVGEPPLMLAISVLLALGDAVAAAGDYQRMPQLDAPATPERILRAVQEARDEL